MSNKFKVVLLSENERFMHLTWEEEYWKKVYKSLFINKLKSLYLVEEFERLKEVFFQIECKVAKSFAVNSLAKKSYLSSEIEKKLEDRAFSPEAISYALSFCSKIGALEDEHTLELRLRSTLRKGKGLLYAKAKWKRSIEGDLGTLSFAEIMELEKQAALSLLEKKNPSGDLYQFLQRRGFRGQVIQEALREKKG